MLNWENLSLKYSQIPDGGFKINKQCIDTNVQGNSKVPQIKMLLT